ncbi:type II secretion system protein N [Serratia sp. L9]|uniref:type II secretion system protein N n=1 Tax=Serratia sp. L9 TaxID=3423946 RepID=UPI003D6648ED
MRRWLRRICLFLLLYIACLLVSLPVRLLIAFSPAQLQFNSVSGTLWHGEAGQLQWGKRLLGKLNWHWGWRHGLPVWRLSLAEGEIGSGQVTIGWMGHWQLSAGHWQLPVERLPALLGYPLALEGRGELALVVEDARFSATECLALVANVEWRSAQVTLLGQTMPLGEPQLRLRCEPERLLFAFQPQQPPLRLFGEGRVDRHGSYHFNGGLGGWKHCPRRGGRRLKRLPGQVAKVNGRSRFQEYGQ